MAKKEETMSMVDTFSEFKELKNIDRTTMISVLEESFRNVLAKMFGTDENFDIIVNPDKGDFEIWRNREVVEDDKVEDTNLQISLSEAKKIDEDYEVGEEVTDEVFFEKFGRRAILNLRQTLASKILELQKDAIYNQYKDKIGQLVSAEVYQIWKKEMLLIDDEGNEMILPKSEQIPGDFYRKGETARAAILQVDNKNNNPKIIVSRTSEDFLRRLFELEVPEIHDGLITIHKVARIPGERAKIAVESYDERIDPVGACVGVKGSRIHGIVRELRNENIDVINYTTNTSLFIQRALNPAKISSIRLNEEEKKAEVFLKPEEVSLAIGKGGLNIKLASMLTGYTIDVYRDIDESEEEDIYLDEFKDEIDEWVIEALKSIGCATAKSVLAKSREDAEKQQTKILTEYPNSSNYYDATCLYSLMSKPKQALLHLKIAFEKGYRDFKHIEVDDDLDNIRITSEFQNLVKEWQDKTTSSSHNDLGQTQEHITKTYTIAMKALPSGVYEVPCKINDLPLKFILDTGASDVTISSTDAKFMLKNNYLHSQDIIGKRRYLTASGDIIEGTKIKLRKIQIGELELRNVEASIVHNQDAPLLLGQSVLKRLGRYNIDSSKSILTITTSESLIRTQ